MDNSLPNPESGSNNQQVETKIVLLRLAVFVFVLFATHVLVMWLYPLGAHRFFWNLALGTLSFWVVLRLVLPRLKEKSPEIRPSPFNTSRRRNNA
jgi:hypothetical protein